MLAVACLIYIMQTQSFKAPIIQTVCKADDSLGCDSLLELQLTVLLLM